MERIDIKIYDYCTHIRCICSMKVELVCMYSESF